MNKQLELTVLGKDLKVSACEYHDGVLVGGCEYRKRNTSKQREFEVKKWESRGYELVGGQ